MKQNSMTACQQQGSKTVAFIDGANLHEGISELGWKLDYKLFRAYLASSYGVSNALLFMGGYIPENRRMYHNFEQWGYSLVFKPTCRGSRGQFKGNCDTDLAVHAIAGCCDNQFDEAVLVSGDGDFASVTLLLASRGKLKGIVAPNRSGCSSFFKRAKKKPAFLESLRTQLEYSPNLGTHVGHTRTQSSPMPEQDCASNGTAMHSIDPDLGLKWPEPDNT